MFKYKFETKKEILAAFKKIKKFIKKGIPNNYFDYVGTEELAQKIWYSFNYLFHINSISEVADIVSRYYGIILLHTEDWEDWEEKLLKLYNECNCNSLEIE